MSNGGKETAGDNYLVSVIVYSHEPGPRLRYIAPVIADLLGEPAVSFTSSHEVFAAAEEIRINYSGKASNIPSVWIVPAGLLEQEGIDRHLVPVVNEWKDDSPAIKDSARDLSLPILFPGPGDLGFDLFSAAFWLISRYEEYLPFTPDAYGRYPHRESMAFRNGFLHRPLVNEWMLLLRTILQRRLPLVAGRLPAPDQAFRFQPTYDIDIAWSYLHKGFLRNTGGWLRSLMRGDRADVRLRANVLRGKSRDPFDAYEWLNALHTSLKLQPIYFFLLASSPKRYDKNADPSSQAMEQLIRHHHARYQTGLHPSWQSGDRVALIKKERDRLQQITGSPVTRSRQHYIRFLLPEGYRRLTDLRITDDHSMGYGDINGFRASLSSPFQWYDLERESATPLTIHPFCFMDANAYYELGHRPEQALSEMRQLYGIVKQAGGTCSMIWHNHFLGTQPAFREWREIYEAFLRSPEP